MNPLRIDVDAPRRPLAVGRIAWLLRRAGYRLRWLSQTRSPGGSGWHLEASVVPCPRSAREVVALQLLCGSDPAREACNLTRARAVDGKRVSRWARARWNVLYMGLR